MLARTEKLIDLVWSPLKENEFVAFDNDIYLYRIVNKNSTNSIQESLIKICEDTSAELIANYAENSNPTVVAWYPHKDNPNMFAVNFATHNHHKIQLLNFNQISSKKRQFDMLKEFSFKQVRQCNTLTWNPYKKNILAAGFERIRTEHSILVWDVRGPSSPNGVYEPNTESIITSSLPSSQKEKSKMSLNIPTDLSSLTIGMNLGISSSLYSYNFGDGKKSEITKSIYETGTSETCNSLTWNPHDENILLAGVNSKSLKIYDIRANTKAGQSVNTKFVNSFSMDGASNSIDYQAASFNENVVAIWDIRMFDKPIHQLNENDTVQKIQWSPTISGKLAVLSRNSNTMNIYTIKNINNSLNASVIEDENAPTQLIVDKISRKCPTPFRAPFNKDGRSNSESKTTPLPLSENPISQSSNIFLSNFCWYNFDGNKILVASNFLLNNLRSLCLTDTIVLTWSPNGELCWSSNLGRLNLIENFDKSESDFTNSFKMRTHTDYGLKYDIISIANNETTMASNSSLYTPQLSTSSSVNMAAVPLALALNSSVLGLKYLIRSDFISNIKLDEFKNKEDDFCSNIKYLWKWFESVNRLFETTIPLNSRTNQSEISQTLRNNLIDLYPIRYCGLKSLLNDTLQKRQNNFDSSIEDRFRMVSYNLCGWDFKDGSLSRQFYISLESSNQFERAACLAVLTDNYEQALETLDNAHNSDKRFGYLWFVLKYFYDEQRQKDSKKHTLTNQTSINLSHSSPTLKSPSSPSNHLTQTSFNTSNNKSPFLQVESTPTHRSSLLRSLSIEQNQIFNNLSILIENYNNAYLKALFAYLINKEENSITKILHDRNIRFQDRIALSVYFMYHSNKQIQLQNFFDLILEDECIKYADLHGILLTGLNTKSIDLFQAFIDKTNDIQTASLAIIHSPYSEVIQSKQVQYWIQSYRDLLNRFKFWEKRAEFDVFKMKLLKSQNCVTSTANENNQNFATDSNVSSSSSSSFTSSNFGNITPTPKHQPQYNNSSNPSILNQMSTRSGFNQSQALKMLNSNLKINPYFQNQLMSQQHNQVQSLVHYNCNECGKNLLEKKNSHNFLISQHFNQPNVPLNQQISINTKNYTNSHTSGSSKIENEITVHGCSNCAHLLPQCVVCLRLMKINLIPNQSQNPNQNYHVLPLNRSQPFLHQTNAKLISTSYPSSKNKSNLLHCNINSPNSFSNENYSLGLNSNSTLSNNLILTTQQSEKKANENIFDNRKVVFQSENIFFLSNSKFGSWFSWCATCKHGGHIKHLVDWFKDHKKCPYVHCECLCTCIDYEN